MPQILKRLAGNYLNKFSNYETGISIIFETNNYTNANATASQKVTNILIIKTQINLSITWQNLTTFAVHEIDKHQNYHRLSSTYRNSLKNYRKLAHTQWPSCSCLNLLWTITTDK